MKSEASKLSGADPLGRRDRMTLITMHVFYRWLPALGAAALIGLGNPAHAEESAGAGQHLLEAELALEENRYLDAAGSYRKAAEESESVEIAEKATRVAYSYGFNNEALKAARRWRELAPDSEEALLYLAQIELRLERLRSARRHFRELVERDQEAADQRLLSLVQILSQEDAKNADWIMRSLSKRYDDSPYAHYAAAVMALQAEDTGHAEERILKALELEPEWLKAQLLYARILLVDGRRSEAIDYTARLIGDDLDPDPEARLELAVMMMTAGRDEDALSQVNQILLEQPSSADALRLMAIINFRLENLDAAWADFQDLLATGRHTMEALYYLARIADFRGEYEHAIRLYSQVRNGMHAVPAQRRVAALIAFEADGAEKALEHLDEFADQNPAHAIEMVLAKAQLLASVERYEESLTLYDRYLEYRPDSEQATLGRAELLLRMDRVADAIAQYRAAVKRWPESAMSLNALGYTLADRSDEYIEAEKLIRKALEFEPDSAAIIDSLGWVLYKLGQPEKAIVELERAYAAYPDHEIAAHIVEVLSTLGRRDEALEFLLAAEQKSPDSELLRNVRERFFPGD